MLQEQLPAKIGTMPLRLIVPLTGTADPYAKQAAARLPSSPPAAAGQQDASRMPTSPALHQQQERERPPAPAPPQQKAPLSVQPGRAAAAVKEEPAAAVAVKEEPAESFQGQPAVAAAQARQQGAAVPGSSGATSSEPGEPHGQWRAMRQGCCPHGRGVVSWLLAAQEYCLLWFDHIVSL